MKVTRRLAVQVHPLPDRAHPPRGPFPPELFRETPIVYEYEPAFNEDGEGHAIGGTAQNNYTPDVWLYCGNCFEKVRYTETEQHICEE